MKPFVVLVGGLVLTSVIAPSAYADDIKTFHNRAAFLAATAATSATGPLPDVGIILDADVSPPVSSYPPGSVTFGLTFGSDNVFMGAAGTPAFPDWYAKTPGNDMAFGWERFEVTTSGPVYSFRFDIVEPDATMPPFGGIPEESTYEFVLYNGPVLVGHVLFDGASIPRTWNLWLVYGVNSQTRLLSTSLPALPSAVSFPISFPLPPIGNIGVLTTLNSASEGIACSDFKTVSTNP